MSKAGRPIEPVMLTEEEEKELKRLGFERMCRGWVKGSKDFRQAVLADLKSQTGRQVSEAKADEMREPRWEGAVLDLLRRLNRSEKDLAASPKGVPWKVAMARPRCASAT